MDTTPSFTLEVRSSYDKWQWNSDDENVAMENSVSWSAINQAGGIRVNWVDNETVEIALPNRANYYYSDIRIKYSSVSYYLYFNIESNTPIIYNDSGNVTFIYRYKFNWKRTYLTALINSWNMDKNVKILRHNHNLWDLFLNQPDPLLKKFEKYEFKWDYRQSSFGNWSYRLRFYATSSLYTLIAPVIYYAFIFDGTPYLFPLIVGGVNGTTAEDAAATLGSGSTPYYNNEILLDKLASQYSSNGFVGKFFGPNMHNIITYKTNFMNIERRVNNKALYGIKFTNDLFSAGNDFFLNIPLPSIVSKNLPTTKNSKTLNIEHLRYLKAGICNGTFNLIALADKNLNYNLIPVKLKFTTIKADGIYCTFENSSEYGTPPEWTIPFSTHLPCNVDSYLKWANDNEVLLKQQRTSTQISSILMEVGGAITALIGLISLPITGGASTALIASGAAIAGGVATAASGLAKNVQSIMDYDAQFNQAKQKYQGNISSGDGTDFAYYYKYAYTFSSYSSPSNTFQIQIMPDVVIQEINNVLYYNGYYQPRYWNVDLYHDNQSKDFLYYKLDANDPSVHQVVGEFVSSWKNNITQHSPEQITNYLIKFLANGIRIWR